MSFQNKCLLMVDIYARSYIHLKKKRFGLYMLSYIFLFSEILENVEIGTCFDICPIFAMQVLIFEADTLKLVASFRVTTGTANTTAIKSIEFARRKK